MTIASWLAGAPRWIKQTFQALVAGGKSPKRAAKLTKLVERAGASEFKPVAGSKGARFFLSGAPKTAPTISRTELIKRQHGGVGPRELAAERKAGIRSYESAASEQQARKQIETRRRFSRVGKWRHPNEVTGRHVFLNKAGVDQGATFKDHDLAVMQTYREDVHGRFDREGNQIIPGALQTGDGTSLRKYEGRKIYAIDGNRVYPETDVNKLRRWWNGKTVRARNQFESELFYTVERPALAA